VFGVPAPTPFDLRFRIFGVPVSVNPWFWIGAAILGWNLMGGHFERLLVWIACVFVSILIHELGHVWAGWLFGSRAHIVLYTFGGLAVGSSDVPRRWQRIIVFLAGPAIQLLLFALLLGLVILLAVRRVPLHPLVEVALGFMLEINLFWALFNLLPIWPLDGGRVSREVWQWLWPAGGVRASLIMSVVVAAVLALNTLAIYYHQPSLANIHPLLGWFSLGHPINALFVAILGASAFFELQQTPQRPVRRWERDEDQEERLPWERDPDYWKSGRKDPWDD
jgi:Zn-dependent protease